MLSGQTYYFTDWDPRWSTTPSNEDGNLRLEDFSENGSGTRQMGPLCAVSRLRLVEPRVLMHYVANAPHYLPRCTAAPLALAGGRNKLFIILLIGLRLWTAKYTALLSNVYTFKSRLYIEL